MKLENNIGWCDATTNAVTGCDKVSPGCKNCYAEAGTRARVLRAQGRETWGAKGERVPVNFELVFRRLNKLCVCDVCHDSAPVKMISGKCNTKPNGEAQKFCNGHLRRIRLFADSNSDWLDSKWSIETLARFLDAIRLTPNVDVQLLTKRIENWRYLMLEARNADSMSAEFRYWMDDWYSGIAPKNIWLGVSVEDQKRADDRIPMLIKMPAAVRFLSVEPLLKAVNLSDALDPCADDCRRKTVGSPPLSGHWHKGRENPLLQWVIVGGESGRNRRDCGVEAIVSVAEQCRTAGVPCYVKQSSALLPGQQGAIPNEIWSMKQFPL